MEKRVAISVAVILIPVSILLYNRRTDWQSSAQNGTSATEFQIATNSLKLAYPGVEFRAVLKAENGAPPYTWQIASGSLPAGLALDAHKGEIFGTPAAGGVFSLRIAATDSRNASASRRLVLQVAEQKLDKFGGATLLRCAKATGYFHLEKLNNRWWFCTPQGHGFWMEGVFDTNSDPHITDLKTSYNQIALRKYGNLDMTWGPQQVRRIKSWGFNSIAEFSNGWTWPIGTCKASTCPAEWLRNGGNQPVPVPMIVQVEPALYSLSNLNNYAPGAVKDTLYGVNRRYWRGYISTFPDLFDPNFALWLDGEMRKDTIIMRAEDSPWVIGWVTDECDELNGLCGAGNAFPTNPVGHNQRSQALVTLLTSPVQTVHPTGGLVRSFEAYSSATVFSKEALGNFLEKKYGAIAALNAAWGANYTTFGTTGTQIVGEKIGTGNGETKKFTAQLQHPDVSAYSVAVRVGGKLAGGDCPEWTRQPACLGAGPEAGALIGPAGTNPAVQFGSIHYRSGAISITFSTPPAAGADVSVDYIHDGWGYGTGLMDEDGRHRWIPSDPVRLGSNAAFKADMAGFLKDLATKYFSTATSTIRKYARHNLVFGPGVLGTWNAPADPNVLAAAAPYVDAIAGSIDYTNAQAQLNFIATYLGDKPMIIWHGAHANADSALWRYTNPADQPCSPCNTQADRAAFYNTSVSTFLNTSNTVYNDYTIIGFRWWALLDSWAQKENWGLISLQDNPYDGVSSTTTMGADPWGYATGGEEKNYGDFLDTVRTTNLQWLKVAK